MMFLGCSNLFDLNLSNWLIEVFFATMYFSSTEKKMKNKYTHISVKMNTNVKETYSVYKEEDFLVYLARFIEYTCRSSFQIPMIVLVETTMTI